MDLNAPAAIRDVGGREIDRIPFDAQSTALLALMAIKGLGLRTLAALCAAGVRPADLLAVEDKAEALDILRRHGARVEGGDGADWQRVRTQAWEKAQLAAENLARTGVSLLLRDSPHFPSALAGAPSAPQWLFVRGSVAVLHRPAIAAVGTRQPSEDGRWLAGFLGAQLHYWGAPTVSGLAVGIDQHVHEWSLRSGVPTIAVLGTGILSEYPKGAEALRERIVEQGGALITEYLPRETYSAENFVKRNRLQAALGQVLVPLEWNARSGTAHTVRFAVQQRKPIACLRLPDWAPDRVVPPKEGGRIFTVPGQEHEFRHFLSECLWRNMSPARGPLFAEETAANAVGASAPELPNSGSQPSLFGGR